MIDTNSLLEQSLKAINTAKSALEPFTTDAGIVSESGRDLKTLADQASQSAIYEILKETDIPILSEEDPESQKAGTQGLRWIVDPLDGTVNFSRGFPCFCISIALWHGFEPFLGVIYDIQRKITYTGVVGGQATANSGTIEISRSAQTDKAILAAGYPTYRDFSPESLVKFAEFSAQFKKIRMIGSAALSLSYVASGVFDYYCEENIWLWDVAAGLAIVKAAGGDFHISGISSDLRATVHAGSKTLVEKQKYFFE